MNHARNWTNNPGAGRLDFQPELRPRDLVISHPMLTSRSPQLGGKYSSRYWVRSARRIACASPWIISERFILAEHSPTTNPEPARSLDKSGCQDSIPV